MDGRARVVHDARRESSQARAASDDRQAGQVAAADQ
jgi:hypothetical protein